MFITIYNLDLLINAVCHEESTNEISCLPNLENIDYLSNMNINLDFDNIKR